MCRREYRLIAAMAALVAALAPGLPGAVAQPPDAKAIRYGEHLAQECTACHRRDGIDNGIPSILGLSQDEFVALMGFYQSGARANAAMASVAKSLDSDQIKALAAYFASLPPPPRKR